MSRKPGIAHDWIERYKDSVYAVDSVVVRDDIRCKPPRFYDAYLEVTDPERFARVRAARARLARERDVDSERLLCEECVKLKKMEKMIRRFHVSADSFE